MNFKESVKHILNTRYINEEEMEEDGGEASCKTKCPKCGKSKCKCSTETKEKSKDLTGEKTPEEKEMLELMKKARKSVSTKTSGGDDDDDGYPRSVATGGDGDDSVAEGFDFAAYEKWNRSHNGLNIKKPKPITINGITYKEPKDIRDIKDMKSKLAPEDFKEYKEWWLQWVKFNKDLKAYTKNIKEDVEYSKRYILNESKKSEKAKNIKNDICNKKLSKKLAEKMKNGVNCSNLCRKAKIAEENYINNIPGALLEYKKVLKECEDIL